MRGRLRLERPAAIVKGLRERREARERSGQRRDREQDGLYDSWHA
jgi:hypothetical protein